MKIKIGRFSGSRVKEYIWVRLGDAAGYDKSMDPYDAGTYVGSSLPITVKYSGLSFNYISGGLEIPGYFTERNYISLFWGDRDAQWIRDLNNSKKREFERGAREGLE